MRTSRRTRTTAITNERPFFFDLNPTEALAAADSMTCCEFGAYWRLILKAWLATPPCTLPSDDGELAKLARLNPSEWAEVRSAVLAGFTTVCDSRLLVPHLRDAYSRIQQQRRSGRNRKRGQRMGVGQGRDTPRTDPGPSRSSSGSESEYPKEKGGSGGGDPPGFARFWEAWPAHTRKVNRKGCAAIWKRDGLEPQTDPILASLARWRASRDWCKDGGEYIPLVATWLNQERWKVGNITEAEEGEQPAFLRVPMSDQRAVDLLGGVD